MFGGVRSPESWMYETSKPTDPQRPPAGPDRPAGEPAPVSRRLRSGHLLIVQSDEARERIEIRSASGQAQVSITLTDQGPVVSLQAAHLQVNTSDALTLNCGKFEVNAREEISLHAGQDLGLHGGEQICIKSGGQTFIDGDYVNLNCLSRKGYHDYDPDTEVPPQAKCLDGPGASGSGQPTVRDGGRSSVAADAGEA